MNKRRRLKTILTTLNAKYIHTSLALRWLYVANKEQFDIDFLEYGIKQDLNLIVEEILQTEADVVGISVSIWNVEQSRTLASILKESRPEIIIILGGPEVSYEPEFFIQNWDIDYIVSGEGEFVLGELLDALEKGGNIDEIAFVSSKSKISRGTAQADIEKLSRLDSPYSLERDKEELRNRIIYFETSRGCPYRCQYCLSSLEKGVRYFPMEYIHKNLNYLIESDTRRIKFLDRTFNLNKKHTEEVFGFLLENYRPELSCQFEIYADLLDDETIESLNSRLPKDFFRFEIGIQSTYEPTNREVKRIQNFPLLASNIQKLMDGDKIDLHLDLIAGLPYETFDRFVQSFNDVFVLRAKELQLGFLKMLRGTALRRNAEKYGYIYDKKAPYEIIEHKDITAAELERIRDAERALEKFWNSGRFTQTMNYVFDNQYKGRYFEFFDDVAAYYNAHNLPHRGYLLEDLFQYIHRFLLSRRIDATELLRNDFYSNFTQRPRRVWLESMPKQESKRMLYEIGQNRAFLKKHGFQRRTIEKQTAIDKLVPNEYLLTIFLETERVQIKYNREEWERTNESDK